MLANNRSNENVFLRYSEWDKQLKNLKDTNKRTAQWMFSGNFTKVNHPLQTSFETHAQPLTDVSVWLAESLSYQQMAKVKGKKTGFLI